MKKLTWTEQDSVAASLQGWDLFDCNGEQQLQRDDESGLFANDDAAMAFVIAQAAAGDDLAQRALAQLQPEAQPC